MQRSYQCLRERHGLSLALDVFPPHRRPHRRCQQVLYCGVSIAHCPLCLCSITSCYSIVGSVDSHGTRCVLWTISVMSTPLELNCASDVYRVDNPILWTFWSTLILICLFSFWIKVARLALIVVKEIDFFFSLCVCVWWGCGGVRSRLLLLVSLISPCNLAPLKSSQKL